MKILKHFFDRIELRPHHVIGYVSYLQYLSDPNREKEYRAYWRQMRGTFHSDELVAHWEKTMKLLNNNVPFRYVPEIDSVCAYCEHKLECHNHSHEYYILVREEDERCKQWLPELEFGKAYSPRFLRKLFERNKWIQNAEELAKSNR